MFFPIICFHMLEIIIPIDQYISEGLKPPTRNMMVLKPLDKTHTCIMNVKPIVSQNELDFAPT